jgi:transcriptional regulator GlxA family with amidase domain
MATSLAVGVLLIPPMQLLDASPIDLFGMLTPEYLEACGLPKQLTNLAIPVSIHYISASGPGTSVSMTASATLGVTDGLSSPAVQPGKLDMLLIPGPDPNLVPDQESLAFIRSHEKGCTTDFLVICTGSFVAGYAGLLDGKRVSGPRGLLDRLKKKFPKAKFVETRWERDGRVWTSGIFHSPLLRPSMRDEN